MLAGTVPPAGGTITNNIGFPAQEPGFRTNNMAAVDYFLKLDGIPGESTDSKHKNEIDVTDWS